MTNVTGPDEAASVPERWPRAHVPRWTHARRTLVGKRVIRQLRQLCEEQALPALGIPIAMVDVPILRRSSPTTVLMQVRFEGLSSTPAG
jgi:hypothetical protein